MHYGYMPPWSRRSGGDVGGGKGVKSAADACAFSEKPPK